MEQTEVFGYIKERFPGVSQEESTKAVIIPKDLLWKIAECLKSNELSFDNLHSITAIDMIDNITVIYTFYSLEKHYGITIKTRLQLDDLKIETLSGIWKSADWLEREVYDLVGVEFLNHPSLSRILNPDNWDGHPLRKNYTHPDFIKKPRY